MISIDSHNTVANY